MFLMKNYSHIHVFFCVKLSGPNKHRTSMTASSDDSSHGRGRFIE